MRVRWLLTADEYCSLPPGARIAKHLYAKPLTKQADGIFTDGVRAHTAQQLDGIRYMICPDSTGT